MAAVVEHISIYISLSRAISLSLALARSRLSLVFSHSHDTLILQARDDDVNFSTEVSNRWANLPPHEKLVFAPSCTLCRR